MELLEYYDGKNEKKLGIAEREEIHENNLWHREIAVWVINEKNELLLQRRSPKKKVGANKLSITAGHIDVGEEPEEAALRELGEEIGLYIPIEELNFIDVYVNERENNKCFSYTYIVKTNKTIKELVMQEDEVSELIYISIGDLEHRIDIQDEEISFVKKAYIRLILEEIKNNYT